MRRTKFVVLAAVGCLLLFGCQGFFSDKDTVWDMVADILLISSPYRVDGKDVVALIWPEPESPTRNWFKVTHFLQIGWKNQNTSGIWNGCPVNVVPASLRGKVLCKKIRLKYRIIKNEGVPLVEIKKIEIL